MAKLTKKQQQQLNGVLSALRAAQRYLLRPDVEVASHVKPWPDGSIIGNAFYPCRLTPGYGLTPMDKQIGSDLAQLHSSIPNLESFIANNS